MNFKKIVPHALSIGFFLLLAALYSSPVLKGKVLAQHDIKMATAASRESVLFTEKTGEMAWWSNSMFGGMPTYMTHAQFSNSISSKIGGEITAFLPTPINLIFLLLLGMYILLQALRANQWQSVLGAVAYAFCSLTMVLMPAGHTSKVIALAYLPMLLAGAVYCFRGKYFLGAALTALFMGLELYANHVQITYYAGLMLLGYVIIQIIDFVKAGQIKPLVFSLIALGAGTAIGVANHTMRLWNNVVYTTETIRGPSELTSNKQSKGGLDRDYAFNWSYGIGETGTLLIPNLYGGKSGGTLGGRKSETLKTMVNAGIPEDAALGFADKGPSYWGSQPFVAGPVYAGAIVMFLFLLGAFLVKGSIKWWLIGTSIFFTILSWGKNFPSINYFMFDHFPMFNKFRGITSILSALQLCLVLLGVLAVKQMGELQLSFSTIKKPLLYSLGISAGLCLIFILLPSVFLDFTAANDATMQLTGDKTVDSQVISAMVIDRISLARTDAMRSLFFILLAAGLIWAWSSQKIKETVFYLGLILLVTLDLFLVSKRYFNDDNFVYNTDGEVAFEPSPLDTQILRDSSIYRVYDGASPSGVTNDATASYFHKSLGGYHGAKLRRYQDIIENQFSKGNMAVFNMLNTKYFTQAPQQQGQAATVSQNPNACGNAWFVPTFKLVKNADEEMKSLDSFNPKQMAFIDQRFAAEVNNLKIKFDSTQNRIKLIDYKPNALTYQSNTQTEQLAIFSEIFYRGNQDWKAYIDGVYKPHFRANYILRGMVVPAGNHKIEFKFEPETVTKGTKVDFIASILLVGLFAIAGFVEFRTKKLEN